MSTALWTSVVRHIRRLAGGLADEDVPDRELLQLFATQHDEAAFALLVERHGPLVLRVCRRVLRHEQDAEDAFQATFLVLAQRAGSRAWQDSISGWLHEVAFRISRKASATMARRSVHERQAGERPRPEPVPEEAWAQLQAVVDEELLRLPEKYRLPVLLCHLEGKSQEEAARTLGWTAGSLRGRLTRGREQLRYRLAKRGLALTAALVVPALARGATTVTVPPALSAATVQAAVHLAAGGTVAAVVSTSVATLFQGAMQTMLLHKFKVLLLVVGLVGAVGAGATGLIHRATAEGRNEAFLAAERRQDRDKDKRRPEEKPREERPREERGREERLTEALLQEVDAAKRQITIQQGRQAFANYEVAKDAKILLAGKPAELADLKANMHVRLKVPESGAVTMLQAFWPPLRATLKAVDAAKGTVTVAIPSRSREREPQEQSETLSVDKEAKVQIDDLPCTLADLTEGRNVVVELSGDRKSATGIQAGHDLRELPAVLKTIDAGKSTMLVTIGPRLPTDLALDMAKDVKVRISGKDGKLADLKEGMRLCLKLAEDHKTVAAILAAPAPEQPRREERGGERR